MAVIRVSDPFRELAPLQERMNRIFEDTLSRSRRGGDEEVYSGTWVPPVDIYETQDKLVLKAELPGFKEDQIGLRFEDNVLTLEGERKFEKERGDESYHRVERAYGRFLRSFAIPAVVDPEAITASFSEGILTVEMTKRQETRPKQIPIKGAAIDVPKK